MEIPYDQQSLVGNHECGTPISAERVKDTAAQSLATPSTLDFCSSSLQSEDCCSTDSVSNFDNVGRDGTGEIYTSFFDKSPLGIASAELENSDIPSWFGLNSATSALLDPSVLRMFVDSLTQSITGGTESPSILEVESSEEGSVGIATPQVATPSSSGVFNRSTTNISTLSHQTGYEGGSSTVMLRNVPYDARQRGVLSLVEEEGFKGQFDFFYAPLDFKSKNNLGYAFINFKSIDIAKRFFRHFDGKRVSSSCRAGWDKPLRVCWARVQSLEANVEHYRNSPVNEMPCEFKPMLFDSDGDQIPFPAPDLQCREESNRSIAHVAKSSNGVSVSTVRPRERRLQSQLSRGFLTPDHSGIGKVSSIFSASSKTPQLNASAGRKLFVGGLGLETSSEQLEQYMTRFGRVSDCNVLIDPQTGRSRCYAFCTFQDEEGSQAALAYPKIHLVDGRGVVVRPYTSSR